MNEKEITITYKNWRGEISERKITPTSIWFGTTKWHNQKQWFLKAHDKQKDAVRDFALRDIIKWL